MRRELILATSTDEDSAMIGTTSRLQLVPKELLLKHRLAAPTTRWFSLLHHFPHSRSPKEMGSLLKTLALQAASWWQLLKRRQGFTGFSMEGLVVRLPDL